MKDDDRTREQLIEELTRLRQRVTKLEAVEGEVRSDHRASDARCAPQVEDEALSATGDTAERKGAEAMLQQCTAQMEALQEVALELAAQLDLETLLHSIVSRAMELLGGSASELALYQPERDVLEGVTTAGAAVMPIGALFQRGEGLSGTIWQTGEPLILDTYEHEKGKEQADTGQQPPPVAVLGVPIWWGTAHTGREFLGTLLVKADGPRTFSATDVELLNLFATQAAVAIRNARLYEELWRRSTEQETVSRLVQALNTFDVREAFPVLSGGLRDLTGCDRVRLALPHRDGEHFTLLLLESSSSSLDEGTVVPMPFSAAFKDLATGRPHLTPDLGDEADFPDEEGLYQAGFRSCVSLPLFIGGEGIGALNLASRQPNHFREHQLPVLQQIANGLASAIDNSHLFEAERRQRQQAETLREAALALTTALDRDEVISRILAQLQQVVPYDSSSVQLLVPGADDSQAGRLVIVGGHGFPNLSELLGISFFIGGDNPNTEVVRTRAPVIVGDAPAVYSDFHDEPHAQAGIRSWLGVPMIMGDRLIGMITLDKQAPAFYTQEHARLAEAFAAHAATAIENARLHRELEGYADQLEQRVQERTDQLAAQLARSDAILRSTTDGIVVTDAHGNILQTNPVAHAWLHHTLSPQNARQLQEAIRDLARRADEIPGLVLELTDLDLALSAAPVAGEGIEKPSAVAVAVHDVSHIKALDRMKAVLIANISHELRHPVTTIKTYAYLIQRTSPDDERWLQYLDALRQETDRQVELVEDIMQMSSIYTGRLTLAPRPTPINELIELVVSTYHTLARERGIVLEQRLAIPSVQSEGWDNGPVVQVDPRHITQALNYLVRDAIVYTPEGGQILVSTEQKETAGLTWITIAVSDSGEEIPAVDLPYAFERFFREEEPQSARVSETGLRLMIVKGIVEQHAGRVTVSSEPGTGTTFTIWLPAMSSLAEQIPDQEARR